MIHASSPINKIEYENEDFPVSVTYVDMQTTTNSNSERVWHEDIEVLIVNHGTTIITFNAETVTLFSGQGIIIGQNVRHSITTDETKPCAYYMLTFHPSFIFDSSENPLSRKYMQVIENRYIIINEDIIWHNDVIDILNAVIADLVMKTSCYDLRTKANLLQFWSILSEHPDNLVRNREDTLLDLDTHRVKEAIIYMKAHYNEKISLEDISNYVHISNSECCRCFKRCIAMTPFEFLMKYRVFEASKLLRDPARASLSIAEIAVSVGFNNFSYFSKQFSRYMNCTPRYYRNNAQLYSPNTDLKSFL